MANKPLSKAELWALGQAIAEAPKRTASPRMRVYFEDWTVESSDGHVYVGDFGTPRSAIRIEGGDADNQIFYIRSKLIDEGNCLAGLRLSRTLPVRWEARGSFIAKHPYSREGSHARVGFWTPGFPTTSWKGTSVGFKRMRGKSGSAYGFFINAKVKVIVGIDADDKVTCVIADSDLDPAWFALGKKSVRPPTRDQAKRLATTARQQAVREAAIENGERLPAKRATAAELRAVARLIAAGPKAKPAKIARRFSLSWSKGKPIPVDGKLAFGDPNGASFEVDAGTTEPTAVFFLTDEAAEDDDGATIGVRLGRGTAVKWKASTGVGVDSGHYGIWSPDLAMPDDLSPGVIEDGRRAGLILCTANGDCVFPSVLGLDAKQQPVALLLGESLDPFVFGISARR